MFSSITFIQLENKVAFILTKIEYSNKCNIKKPTLIKSTRQNSKKSHYITTVFHCYRFL